MSRRRRELADPRSLEAYIRSGLLPRFSQRLRTIEDDLVVHRDRLAQAYAEMQIACAGDAPRFEERWRDVAYGWDFATVNELIHQHNEYYPIERNLPVNPRTGDYVTPAGRPYWRVPAGPEWVLERFPAVLVMAD